MNHIWIINGPNLNLLGQRQPEIYGKVSFADYFSHLKNTFADLEISYFQSNHEGKLIDKIHEVGFNCSGIVLNAGGYSHTSIALADALVCIPAPIVEVHISNLYARESFRQHSYLTKNCLGIIAGFGLEGYRMAIDYLLRKK